MPILRDALRRCASIVFGLTSRAAAASRHSSSFHQARPLGRPGQLQCLRPGIRLTRSPAAPTVRQRPLRHNPECSADRTPAPTPTQGEALRAALRCRQTQVSGGVRIPHPKQSRRLRGRHQRRSLETGSGSPTRSMSSGDCGTSATLAHADRRVTPRSVPCRHVPPQRGSWRGPVRMDTAGQVKNAEANRSRLTRGRLTFARAAAVALWHRCPTPIPDDRGAGHGRPSPPAASGLHSYVTSGQRVPSGESMAGGAPSSASLRNARCDVAGRPAGSVRNAGPTLRTSPHPGRCRSSQR